MHQVFKPLASAGASYFLNLADNRLNQLSMPGTMTHKTAKASTLSRLIHPQKTQSRANRASAFFNPTSTHISSTQLPKPSLPFTITDAIGSPKSHRNLMPLLWDLIEPHIKCKWELLLPWRYMLSLASTAPTALKQSLQHP